MIPVPDNYRWLLSIFNADWNFRTILAFATMKAVFEHLEKSPLVPNEQTTLILLNLDRNETEVMAQWNLLYGEGEWQPKSLASAKVILLLMEQEQV